MMKFLKGNYNNLQELKKEFKKMVMQYHPDHRKDENLTSDQINEDFRTLKDEYNKIVEYLASGRSWEAKQEESEQVPNYELILRPLIKWACRFENIEIVAIGSWLWIGGDTKPIKEQLKEKGFKWSTIKKKWYYNTSDKKYKYYKGRKLYNFEELKELHKSQVIKNRPSQKIANV